MIVGLHGAEFFAYHGFYPEEQHTGSCFIVDIETELNPSETDGLTTDNIDDTVNYEALYDISHLHMQQPQKLIETVATLILNDIKARYSFVDKITVRIKKLNPLAGAKVKYTEIIVGYSK